MKARVTAPSPPRVGDLLWHIHHEVLCEPLIEPFINRVVYIKNHKPVSEVPTRLRLMKPVRNQKAIAPAWKVYEEAKASARKVYAEAKASALKVYEEAVAPARKVYEPLFPPHEVGPCIACGHRNHDADFQGVCRAPGCDCGDGGG